MDAPSQMGVIWGVGVAWSMWADVFASNPWPRLGLFALTSLGLLISARRRRRRW